MRLVNGPNSYSGTIEMFHDGAFGTICHHRWDDYSANVACNILGYNGGVAMFNAAYGPGSGDILLDDVYCWGGEPTLAHCDNSGWGNHECTHELDAGISCGNC